MKYNYVYLRRVRTLWDSVRCTAKYHIGQLYMAVQRMEWRYRTAWLLLACFYSLALQYFYSCCIDLGYYFIDVRAIAVNIILIFYTFCTLNCHNLYLIYSAKLLEVWVLYLKK